jgi:hypothetical protein
MDGRVGIWFHFTADFDHAKNFLRGNEMDAAQGDALFHFFSSPFTF